MDNPVRQDVCFPEITAMYDELKEFRRDIHAHPECGFETERTIGKIREFLLSHGVAEKDIDTTTSKGSLFALIEGSEPGKTVALRADIDALKMKDFGGKPWSSQVEGRCHACGHDGHQTWLLGAAAYLAAHRNFAGRVLCVFQAAEETGQGALAIVNSGALEKYQVAETIGAHDEPGLKKGQIGFKVGHIQAASDSFAIKLIGKGTHGGRPHQGVDPIPAASELYQALQTIVSRKVDPLESAVVSICYFSAGMVGTYNVVSGEVQLGGTVRTFLPELRDLCETTIRRMAEGIALAHGLTAEVDYIRLIPSVNNDKEMTESAIKLVTEMLGEENVNPSIGPYMSSEDFSRYQAKIPGTICRIGIVDDEHKTPLHNPKFDFNDEVLPLASTVLAKLALSRLAK